MTQRGRSVPTRRWLTRCKASFVTLTALAAVVVSPASPAHADGSNEGGVWTTVYNAEWFRSQSYFYRAVVCGDEDSSSQSYQLDWNMAVSNTGVTVYSLRLVVRNYDPSSITLGQKSISGGNDVWQNWGFEVVSATNGASWEITYPVNRFFSWNEGSAGYNIQFNMALGLPCVTWRYITFELVYGGSAPPGGYKPKKLDFSGDGKADVVWRRPSDNTLRLLEGNGQGGWLTSTIIKIGSGWGDAELLMSPGDWSGDGRPDLIWRKSGDKHLYMIKGDGETGWLSGPIRIGNNWADAEMLTSPGDWTGDGKPDLIWRKSGDKHLYMIEGDGHGGWLNGIVKRIGSGWGDAQMLIAPGDFSGDGKPDLVWRKSGDKHLYMLEGNGLGGWLTGTVVRIGTDWGDAQLLSSPGDFSGDRRPDLIWRKSGDQDLYMIRSDGDGGFGGNPLLIGTDWQDANAIV